MLRAPLRMSSQTLSTETSRLSLKIVHPIKNGSLLTKRPNCLIRTSWRPINLSTISPISLSPSLITTTEISSSKKALEGKPIIADNAEIGRVLPLEFITIAPLTDRNSERGTERTSTTFKTEVNSQLASLGLAGDISYNIVNNKSYFRSASSSYSFATNVDICGNTYEMNGQNNLGWVFGFRDTSYNLTTAGLTSECILNLKTPRHLFLALNEFSQGNSNSFVSPLEKTNQSKNIIAKICLSSTVSFGDTLCANKANGLLVSEVRKYLEKVNIQRMNLQLLDDSGRVINLNGADFSICLRLVHE